MVKGKGKGRGTREKGVWLCAAFGCTLTNGA